MTDEPKPRTILVGDVLATAERLVWAPAREAVHLSIDDRLALAAFAIVADRIIRGAGLSYPGAIAPEPASTPGAPG